MLDATCLAGIEYTHSTTVWRHFQRMTMVPGQQCVGGFSLMATVMEGSRARSTARLFARAAAV